MTKQNSFLQKCRKIITTLDNYRLSILLGIPICLGVLIFLFFSGGFILPIWFLNLFLVPAFIGRSISGLSYLVRILDYFKIPTLVSFISGATSQTRTVGKMETSLTIIGCLIAIGLTTLYCFTEGIPLLLQPLGIIAAPIYSLGFIGSIAGLHNRIGACIDNTKLPNEKKILIAGVILGLVFGAGIFLFCPPAAVAGIVSFITLGAKLPTVICGFIFVMNFTSVLVSAMDYSARSWNYLRVNSQAETHTQLIKERIHEYRGSFVGTILGLTVGTLIITGLLLTQPQFFIGLAAIVTSFMIMASCVGTLGGLSQRIGRLLDGFKVSSQSSTSEDVEKNIPLNQEITETKHFNYVNNYSLITQIMTIAEIDTDTDELEETDCNHLTSQTDDLLPLPKDNEHKYSYLSSQLLSKYGITAQSYNHKQSAALQSILSVTLEPS